MKKKWWYLCSMSPNIFEIRCRFYILRSVDVTNTVGHLGCSIRKLKDDRRGEEWKGEISRDIVTNGPSNSGKGTSTRTQKWYLGGFFLGFTRLFSLVLLPLLSIVIAFPCGIQLSPQHFAPRSAQACSA
jgi:hypothetical protein